MGESRRVKSEWARQHEREDLAGEHRWGDAFQLAMFLLFLIVWGGDSFLLKLTTGLADQVPLFLRIGMGGVLMALAWILAVRGLRVIFGEERTVPVVIQEGVFGRVRHPIYLGAVLLYLGLLVTTLSLAAAGVWIAAILMYHLLSRHEEERMAAKFGEAYESYRRRVPMWLPRMGRSHHTP